MTSRVAVSAFDLAPVFWLRTVTRKMSLLLAVVASDVAPRPMVWVGDK